jgi:arylsulfatase A-like enzyme
MAGRLTRREFLKLAALSPLPLLRWPDGLEQLDRPPAEMPRTPNILIVVFDALSAGNMSLYGYARQTTPQLERLAGRALVYHRHYAAGNFTTPGVASIFTGMYPWSHRAFNLSATIAPQYQAQNLFRLASPRLRSFVYTQNDYVNVLFDQLHQDIQDWTPTHELCLASVDDAQMHFDRDYFTASNAQSLLLWRTQSPSSSFFISRFNRLRQYTTQMRLNRQYGKLYPRGVPNYSLGFFTLEQAIDWTLTQASEQTRPFLGYVHLFPPHDPYTTRSEFFNRFADGWRPAQKPRHHFAQYANDFLLAQRQAYDENIAYVDAEFGRLFDALQASGALQDTLLIFTSDHGELFERGVWAHETPVLYEPVIHVPLIVWPPGLTSRQDIHTPTSAVDLLPTLLSISQASIPARVEGKVLPGFNGEIADPRRAIYSLEAKMNPKYGALKTATLAMIQGPLKLIRYVGYKGYPETYELYDLENDPQELNDLYPSSPPEAGRMRQEMLDTLQQADI